MTDGKNPLVTGKWSRAYVICLKNRTLDIKECDTGVFDPSTRTCKIHNNTGKIIVKPCLFFGSHLENCKKTEWQTMILETINIDKYLCKISRFEIFW